MSYGHLYANVERIKARRNAFGNSLSLEKAAEVKRLAKVEKIGEPSKSMVEYHQEKLAINKQQNQSFRRIVYLGLLLWVFLGLLLMILLTYLLS